MSNEERDLTIAGFQVGQVMPIELVRVARALPQELLMQSAEELYTAGKLKYTESRIRQAFWSEYEAARANYQMMSLEGIAARAATHVEKVRAVFARDLSAAFVLTPPDRYVDFIDEALMRGLMRLREVLEFPLRNPQTGMPDLAAAELILKITGFIDLRKHGGIVQKQLNVNVGDAGKGPAIQVGQKLTNKDLKDIDAKIAELERTMGREHRDAFKVIDVIE